MPALDRSLIRSMALFERMSDDELDDVLSKANVRRVPSGQAVFEQGKTATEFFVLLNGRLKVSRVTPNGQQVMVRVVNPGDLFGIAKALQRPDYPGTAVAAGESLVLAWPMANWDLFVDHHPSLAVNAMQTIGQRLQEAQTRILEMATEDVERRVAHAVLRLVQQSGKKEAEGIRIDFPVSRQDVAEMTGTTLHTVSRLFSAWEAQGIVKGGRQKLLVRDPHGLMLIAEGRER
ncbi:Crp/Fnr family transcriptional regulator [Cucumibacter marinus]|uniref:Crp/Fnr family transcriptional regulator n=1 Tax=Cucumibacter marinus TaxID=1121252 RepID=UPI00040ED718|nr:Crp/Fnr family transcriptional regulator [Cucumibacter marinus]